jgi:hypothetical protein
VTRRGGSSLAALLLLAAGASAACGRLEATPPLPASTRAGSVRPADLRDEAAALLALAPDRRVLAALADLEPILSRSPRPSVAARRLPSGRFAIVRDQEPLGELAAFASLDESLGVLGARASKLLGEHPLTPLPPGGAGDVEPSSPIADPIVALAAAEKRLRTDASAASLRDATHAAVALARLVPAEARASDVVQARALALFAIESVVAPAAAAAERPLLADAMGYPEDAERARAASAAERTRLGPRGDTLLARAESSALTPASLAARLREGRGEGADDEIAVARASLAVAVLEAARANGDERAAKAKADVDALAPRAAASVPMLVYGWLGTQPAQAIGRFSSDVAKAYASELGPILDAELRRAILRGFFFDAVAHLGRPPRGGAAPELAAAGLPQSRVDARLVSLRAAAPGISISLAADEARELADVGAIEPFAVAAATRGLDDAERAQLPALLRAVDGRPANRAALSSLVRDALGDDDLAQRWSKSGRVEPAASLWARGDAAQVGLRGADRDGAARSLASPAIAVGAWSRVVAPRLVAALREARASDADVDLTVGALRGAGLGLPALRALAVALLRDGRDGPAGRLAMAVLRADTSDPSEGLDRLAMQIVARRSGMLPEAALPPHVRDLAAHVAFELGEDGVLRALGPASRPGDVAELRLLLRAAAAMRARDRDRLGVLRAELVPPSGRGFYGRLAALLLDGADEAALAATPVDPAAACEAAHFLAFRAEIEGRADDARAWRRAVGICPAMHVGER